MRVFVRLVSELTPTTLLGGDMRDRTADLKLAKLPLSQLSYVPKNGGEGEIRTHGTLSRTTVFKTVAINRSATSPNFADGYALPFPAARSQRPLHDLGLVSVLGRGVGDSALTETTPFVLSDCQIARD